MAERLFHLVEPSMWPADGSPHAPPSLELEGFLHASFAAQLPGTLAVHFDPSAKETPPRLLLIELDPTAIASDLRVESSRGGEDFPHLYRALRACEVLRWWTLEHLEGRWLLPELSTSSVADDPQGTPGSP